MDIFFGLQSALLLNETLLPGATIYFTVTQTETPVSIWANDSLTVPLPNPLTADSAGRWPAIYLSHLIHYRVRMYDANGVLIREADPYLPDPPVQVQPLSDDGEFLPFCRLTFWRSQTDALAPIYEDSELIDELPNPITADETGTFPVIFMDPDRLYRVKLESADGRLRYDIDPYLSPGYLALTSRPYAVEEIESLVSSGIPRRSNAVYDIESLVSIGIALGGTLHATLFLYDDALPEGIESYGVSLDGTLRQILRSYDDAVPEAIESSGLALDGTLDQILITYQNYPPEAISSYGTALGGTLV